MKKSMSLLAALCLGGMFSFGTASAESITNTVTQLVGDTPLTFNFAKFNQSLGTLTAVTFTIVSSVDQGSFTIQNNAPSSARVRNPLDSLYVVDNQGSGGDYIAMNVSLTTAPSTSGTGASLAANSSGTYTLAANQTLASNISFNIASIFWGSYSSSNGTGLVSFDVDHTPAVTVTGGNYTADTSNVKANTTLSLTYTYTAVPEPSNYVLFGLGALALVVAYRRKRAA